jgi:MFS family permease
MRVESPTRSAARNTVDSPYAWIMTVAAFITCFVAFGVVYSFGAFFKPIAAEFGATRADILAVFSITAAIYSLLGLATGTLADRYGPRVVVLIGAIAMGAGLLTTATIDRLWVGYVSYGLGVGVGVACVYVPMLALVGGWFSRRRNLALGIAVSGIGAGTLVFAPLAAKLIERFGWREAYLILGATSLILLGGCALIVTAPPATSAAVPRKIKHLAHSPEFIRLYIACLLSSVWIYIPFVYLPDFAQSRGSSGVLAAGLVGVVGASSVVGRLSFGAVADRIGTISFYKASLLVLALSYAIWPIAYSYPMLLLFAIVMGAAYGGLVSLTPAVVAELFGVDGLGSLLGTLYTSSAVSALAGPPLAGFAIDHGGSYPWAAAVAGVAGLGGFVTLLALRPDVAIPAVLPETEARGY